MIMFDFELKIITHTTHIIDFKRSHSKKSVRFFNRDFDSEGDVGGKNKVDIRIPGEILHRTPRIFPRSPRIFLRGTS